MYQWNHTHSMYNTIGTLYDITSTLADNAPLFVCHGTHSVYYIICITYDVIHSVFMTMQGLYLTWNRLKLPSHPLCMSSHPLCRGHHTYCVRHHRWHIYAIICVIHGIISTFYDKIPYYLWHHMHYVHYNTRTIYGISSTLYDVTFPMCVTSHNDYWSMTSNTLCLWDIHLYGITHSVMTTQPLCAFTATMRDITLSVF